MNVWRVSIDELSGKLLSPPEPVTTPSPYTSHLSMSADGRHVAYVQQVSTTNILKADFDPSREAVIAQPVPVTTGTRDAWLPDVSPDGQWLAFGSSGREDIFVVRTDGAGLRQLTDDDYRDRAPVWSPDGKQIAFISNRSNPSGLFEIWVVNPDGSGLRQLTFTSSKVASVPVWSPDGARLAYPIAGYEGFTIEARKSWNEQSPKALARMPEPNARFMIRSWSPDGKRLAGERRLDDGTAAGIVIYSFDSGKFEGITDLGWYPYWLSDGVRLLFQHQGKLYIVDSRSQKQREVLSLAPQEVAPYRFALSRNDRWIYFGVTVTEADIWLMNLE